MSLKEPIVEGAYYERGGEVHGPAVKENYGFWRLGPYLHHSDGRARGSHGKPLTRRVYLVPTDPAEVVAALHLRASDTLNIEYERAARIVAEKLGVES